MAQSNGFGDRLTAEEQEAWFVEFTDKMAKPNCSEEAFFRARRELGRGVGLSKAGDLVYQRDTARN